MLQFIATGDHKLMRKVNKWPAPKWVRYSAIAATRAGDGWLWYLCGLVVLLAGRAERFTAAAAAGSAALAGVGIFLLVKRISGRKRPCEYEPHVWARLLPPDQFSFPSGHTITAFAVAVTLGAFYPPFLGLLLLFALVIGASRILLGMHFLSDVLVGMLLGVGIGMCSFEMFS